MSSKPEQNIIKLMVFCIIAAHQKNPLNFYLNYSIKMITVVSFYFII